jgi:SsrA-binding protein
MGNVIATNKKAYRDFFFSDKWECGVELKGGEVKSIRAGHVNFKDTFARADKGEILLYSLHIEPYKQASHMNDEPDRVRKLLLHKREIRKIEGIVAQKNLALVPTRVYFNKRGLVKIEIALGKGKKLIDKRDAIQKRDIDRDLDRAMKNRSR